MTLTETTIVRDRNKIAYLIACGFQCDFIPRGDDGLDAEFPTSNVLEAASMAYVLNQAIPVQSFISACRYISDAIRDHRQQRGVIQ